MATGEWVHVVMSWASSDGIPRLWINGEQQTHSTPILRGSDMDSGGCLMLGRKATTAAVRCVLLG